MSAQVNWNGGTIAAAINRAVQAGLREAADRILQQSDRRMTDEQKQLVGPGEVTVDPANLAAAVGYNSPEAVRAHKATQLNVAGGPQAKFLEQAALQNAPAVGAIVAAKISETLKG